MHNTLPSGTVTFLFTDIEGSTRLLDELGAEAYAGALAEHRVVVRDACSAHGGVEVDTQGDAFFVAFPTAPGALAAAGAITDGLRTGPIHVRIGLHTGTPFLTDEGYVGPDVHRAARIAAAGHGGQVLVSASTAALVDTDTLADLGDHRFKDLGAPERLYQVGNERFEPLKSLYRTNLPVPATSFLGRRRELDDVVAAVTSPDISLLTMTGPGGTGKTRLALHAAAEAAESFPDGVWWVPLAPLRSAHLLVTSVAQAMQIEEQPGRALADVLAERLAGKRTLLLLDNAEHLVPAVADEIARVRDVAGPTILVTSRERLQLDGEHVYAVPPLDESDGFELFVTRARAVTGVQQSTAVADLCARLDNLPLAIELAAARTVVFSPQQLLERLTGRLDLLRGGRGGDPRQQTLRATIEWSHDLLDAAEQTLFRRLSVFAGGCSLEAVEAVCDAGADIVQSLFDKSLLRRSDLHPPRFWMLETIRELAAEKLADAGDADDVRRRHAEHFLAVAQSANLDADREGPQRHDLVIPERDNMRAGLAYALESGRTELGIELLVALENYWATSSPEEGVEWAAALLADTEGVDRRQVARALRVQGGMQNFVGQLESSEASWEQALAIFNDLGDDRGIAVILHRFSNTAIRRGDVERVRTLAEESLARHRRSGGFAKGETQALHSLAWVARANGDRSRALELLDEARDLAEAAGFHWWRAGMLSNSGEVLLELGRLDDARGRVREALQISRAVRDRFGTVYELRLLAEIAEHAGQPELAGRLLGAAEAEHERAPAGFWIFGSAMQSRLLESTDPELARGRAEGRLLELDAAVAVALGDA